MAWLETDRHGRLRIAFKYYDGRTYRENPAAPPHSEGEPARANRLEPVAGDMRGLAAPQSVQSP